MRNAVRSLLILTLLLSVTVVGVVLWKLGPSEPNAWATVAAALAVVTSVIGSWTAQRVLELEEDKQRPNPSLRFDLSSRDELILLRLANTGGSPAYDISISWANPLHDHQKNEVHFSDTQPEVTILLPGESLAIALNASSQFLKDAERSAYSGTLNWRDSRRRRHASEFLLSADHYRRALKHDTEDLATHKKLQELPRHLDDIANVLRGFQRGE